jgi:hypothetical protein
MIFHMVEDFYISPLRRLFTQEKRSRSAWSGFSKLEMFHRLSSLLEVDALCLRRLLDKALGRRSSESPVSQDIDDR